MIAEQKNALETRLPSEFCGRKTARAREPLSTLMCVKNLRDILS